MEIVIWQFLGILVGLPLGLLAAMWWCGDI